MQDPLAPDSQAEHDSFNELLQLVDAGDQDAVGSRIFVRFTNRLISLARTRLSDKLKTKVDAEDVVQSAYRSFFNRQAADEFELENWERLWGLLAVLTLRKCYARVDYHYAEKRDVRREVSSPGSADVSIRSLNAESTEPTPEEAAAITEILEQTMRDLDAKQREILSMTLQGYEVREISDHVQLSERTVHRVRNQLRQHLTKLVADLD